MNKITKNNYSILILAFIAGCTITVFNLNIGIFRRSLILDVELVIWLQVIYFVLILTFTLILFHLAKNIKYRALIITAATSLVFASVIITLWQNFYSLFFSRIFDSIAVAILVTVLYLNLISKKPPRLPLALLGLGSLMGPWVSLYSTNYFSISSLDDIIFFFLPLLVVLITLCEKNEALHFPKVNFKKNAFIKIALYLIIASTSISLIFLFYKRSSWTDSYTFLLTLVFIISTMAFIKSFLKSGLSSLSSSYTNTQKKVILAAIFLNIVIITTLYMTWLSIAPIYSVEAMKFEFKKLLFVVTSLNLFIFLTAYFFSYIKKTLTTHQLTIGYVLVILTSLIIASYKLILGATLYFIIAPIFGIGIGLVYAASINYLHTHGLSPGKTLLFFVYSFCFSIIISFLPLALYFCETQLIYITNYIEQHQILIPESMPSSKIISNILLSNKQEMINFLKNYNEQGYSKLLQGFKESYIVATQRAVTITIIASIIGLFASYILLRKEANDESNSSH